MMKVTLRRDSWSTMRLPKQRKLELAREVRDAILPQIKKSGELEKILNRPGRALRGKVGSLDVLHVTPFTGVEDEAPGSYGLDLWTSDGKVFSVWWDPLEIVTFRYGAWMNEVVPGSYQE